MTADARHTIPVEFLGGPLEGRVIAHRPSHCAEGQLLIVPVRTADEWCPSVRYHRERYVVHWHGGDCEAIHDGRE